MQPRERSTGTNRDFRHHTTARPKPRTEPSDRQLLRQAAAATRQWQTKLAKTRRAEAQR